jgi:hypothetical protein
MDQITKENSMHRKSFTLLILVTILVSLACNFSAPTPTPEPPRITVPYPDTLVPPPPLPTNTEVIPEVIDTSQPSADTGPLVQLNWFSFYLPATIASSAQSSVLAAVTPSDQIAPWEIAPQHEEMTFTGYILNDTFHEAKITVYPIQDFIAIEPTVANQVTELQKIILEKLDNPGNVPILPLWNAAQVFLSNPAYLDFQNGSGIRYLTQYGQAIMPINNHDLFYSFQGLTSDGKYWISAILPVNHSSLQATYDNPLPSDMDQFYANYEQYTTLLRANLDTQPPETFKPSLADLDAMVSSIVVTH